MRKEWKLTEESLEEKLQKSIRNEKLLRDELVNIKKVKQRSSSDYQSRISSLEKEYSKIKNNSVKVFVIIYILCQSNEYCHIHIDLFIYNTFRAMFIIRIRWKAIIGKEPS